MSEPTDPSPAADSLDIVERVMAIEEALISPHLSPEQRERLIRDIAARIADGEFGHRNDFDDDALAAFVRKHGPRTPKGHAGAAAHPEEPFVD